MLKLLQEIFMKSLCMMLKQDVQNILSGASERNLCARFAIYLVVRARRMVPALLLDGPSGAPFTAIHPPVLGGRVIQPG